MAYANRETSRGVASGWVHPHREPPGNRGNGTRVRAGRGTPGRLIRARPVGHHRVAVAHRDLRHEAVEAASVLLLQAILRRYVTMANP